MVFAAGTASAQTTTGYSQFNLACHSLCAGGNQSDTLVNPWGVAILPGNDFFIAEHGTGRIEGYSTAGILDSSIQIPLPAGSTATASKPTGVVVDPDLNFGPVGSRYEFFVATEEGTIVGFKPNNRIPDQATIVRDKSDSAVYTGLTLLHPNCCGPMLAVANFHDAQIEVYALSLTQLPGNFEDPNLPAGYAPYNIQTIGNQVFVTYAKQDQSGRAPVAGAGNGIVSIFDQDGNFVRRFISDGGNLNIPWGITKASANFGLFANDILIGNVGDFKMLVYNPTTGEFLGPLTDSLRDQILNPGTRGMIFRNDGVGDQDNLYFASGVAADGKFSFVGVGLLTHIIVSANDTAIGVSETIRAQVTPITGNLPVTGTVSFSDSGLPIGTADLANGTATISHTFNTAGVHDVTAEYLGQGLNFLPSLDRANVTVSGPATTTVLHAPVSAAVGANVIFTAQAQSAAGVPSGSITFKDGSNILAVVLLDASGVAALTTDTLSAGVHSVTATFSGDFQSSVSDPVTVTIGGDFRLDSNPQNITITAGQSASFMLTVTPTDGFTGAVTFQCLAPAGINCSFNPSTVNVNAVAASTMLTARTSTTLARSSRGLGLALTSLGLLGSVLIRRRAQFARSLITLIAVSVLGLTLVDCGGYGSKSPGTTTTTSTVTLTATSGGISHSTNVSITCVTQR